MEKTIIVRFTKQTWNTPVIHGLSRKADLVFNILEAKVLPRQEAYAIMNLEGTAVEYAKGIEYLKSCNVLIEEVTDTIQRDEDSCVHCGACLTVCPSGALYVDGPERKVALEKDRCIACGNCVDVCTVHCMSLYIFS
ncbi:MAG: 4Fe-4S binding protein [bacterium]|nr:4Fe-4S binding protein [bacterium]MDT8395683.1 4Fe-4S binding protein [bacterium]